MKTLRELREARGLTLRQVGDAVGHEPAHIMNVEKSVYDSPETVHKILAYLGLDNMTLEIDINLLAQVHERTTDTDRHSVNELIAFYHQIRRDYAQAVRHKSYQFARWLAYQFERLEYIFRHYYHSRLTFREAQIAAPTPPKGNI